MNRLQLAIEQIVFARNYTIGLLDQTPMAEWYRQPPGGVSHVGHIAFSEYRLALWRIRGQQPQDDALFSPEFKRLFGANSVPDANSAYPADEIRAVLNRVHEQVLRELPGLDETELDHPVPHPHPFAKTKLLALLWAEAMQAELKPFGIRVQTINPGAYLTGFNEAMAENAFRWLDDGIHFTKRAAMRETVASLIGSADGRRDPEAMIRKMIEVIAATDGKFRNVFPQSVEDLLKAHQAKMYALRI